MARIEKDEIITADFLNRHDESDAWWRRNKARGEGGSLRASPVNFTKVTAANYIGQQIYIGEVCEFDGNPFPDPDLTENYPDPRNDRWLKAVTPDLTHAGWGIALDPIDGAIGADREGGEFVVLGVCYARVVITDETHLFARREAGQRALQSSDRGAVKLLHVGSPTGNPDEYLCLVHILDDTPNWYLGIVREDYTQGYVPGGAPNRIKLDLYVRDIVAHKWQKIPGFMIEAEDWFLQKDEVLEKLTKVRVDWYINCWVVTDMHCSPTDLDEFKPSPSTGSPGEMEGGEPEASAEILPDDAP